MTSKEDFQKVVGFGEILNYRSNLYFIFCRFNFSESGEHFFGCRNVSERFCGWFSLVIHAVKEVIFHDPSVHNFPREVNYYSTRGINTLGQSCI